MKEANILPSSTIFIWDETKKVMYSNAELIIIMLKDMLTKGLYGDHFEKPIDGWLV